MNRKRAISVIPIVLISFIMIYLLGLYNRYNIITGMFDRLFSKTTIVYYGEPRVDDEQLHKIAQLNGFNYKRIAGCNVSTPLINGARHYNWIMKNYLKKKHSDEFLKRF